MKTHTNHSVYVTHTLIQLCDHNFSLSMDTQFT